MGNAAGKLRELRSRTGMSMKEFARALGYRDASGYQRYEAEETFADGKPLSTGLAKKLMKLVGTGKPVIRKAEIAALTGIDQKPSGKEQDDESGSRLSGTAQIGEVDIRAGLGGGGFVEAVNRGTEGGQVVSEDALKGVWQVPAYYLREMGLTERGLYLFRAVGDSMTRPDGGGIHSGDILLADTKDKHPSPPGVFALDDGFGVVVKRLEFIAYSDPAKISIRSDNPAHKSYELPADEVRVIGRCVWYGRQL